ncbi:MAG TPA: hypothetical protein VJG83_03990 [archaeon]|nr:hypothetical protein [archaeon]
MILEIIKECEQLISKNQPFEYWKLLEKSEKEISGIENKIEGEIEEFVAIKGNLQLGSGSIIKSGSRIEGNVYIGKNCVIGPNAFLRSGAVICDNCHIGTCEIKNSIILEGSKVPHYSYVGDSVIGKNCNLGAGTKIANLRHDHSNVSVNINGKKVDSGRKKLGALLFDKVKTGVNSSINCGAIVEGGALILPNGFRK